MFRLSPYALSPLLGCLVLLALSWLAYTRRRKGGPQLAFALVNLAVAGWNLDILLLYTVKDAATAHFIDRVFQPVIVTIPVAWLNFVMAFLRSRRRGLLVKLYGVWSIALAAISTSPLFLRATVRMYFGYYGSAGPLYFLYVLTHLSVLLLAIALLADSYRRTTDLVMKNQVGYLLLATVILGFLSADNFFPLYGVERYPLGNIAVILYLIVVGVAVIRHRFMDLPTFVRQSLIYSIATTLLTAVYLLLILLMEGLVRIYLLPQSLLIPLLPALVVAFMFQGVRERVQSRLDHIFGHERRRTDILSSFARMTGTMAGRGELAEHFCRKVTTAFGATKQAFFTRDPETGRWRTEVSDGLNADGVRLITERLLPEVESIGHNVIDLNLTRHISRLPGDVRAAVIGFGFSFLLPLRGRNSLSGIFLLGDKSNGGPYSAQDMAFLGALSGQVAAALEAREYYERWTREEKLISLGRASATISHEMRNPLNIIKGAVTYLKTRYREKEIIRFTDIISQEVDKTARFIEQFLRASRVPLACRREVEIGAWLRQFMAQWSCIHPSAMVVLNIPPRPLCANVDTILLAQLLENLCGNALEACTGNARIEITLDIAQSGEGEAGLKSGPELVLTVADDGPGINDEQKDLVFDPFFTTKSGGTGLGLCVVDGVVKAHGGRIRIESAAGGGALFRIGLPLDGGAGMEKEDVNRGVSQR